MFPKISFGIIVLNGEPFTKYCLRQLYPHAHEIIVVEGAVEGADCIAQDGRSTDNTITSLKDFKKYEDPHNKLKIVQTKGFWKEKEQQSQAYAEKATGDYLWQVDIDEFYKNEDIEKTKDLLTKHPDIEKISFRQITFWGGFDYCCDSIFLRDVFTDVARIFRWRNGYKYVSHRPPTIIDRNGIVVGTKKKLCGSDMAKMGIYLYHYSLLFPKQVREKCDYYTSPGGGFMPYANKWAQNCYFKLNKPFKVHNVHKYPSWLEKYKGIHPEEIIRLSNDIKEGKIKVETRGVKDIEKTLSDPFYSFIKRMIIILSNIGFFKILLIIRNFLKRPLSEVK